MQDNENARSPVATVVRLMRPKQWIKNAFVFAALVFAGKLLDPQEVLFSVTAFVGFCFLSSAGYAVNDIVDAEADRRHPKKKSRPVASGQVSPTAAALLALLWLGLGAALCLRVNAGLLMVGVAYVLLNLLYTYWLKRHMLVDVMVIAFGFVLRAIAGGVAIGVQVSPWLMVCTFTLCMFLGFGKRRCEVADLGGNEPAAAHRITLSSYSLALLDQLLSVSAGVAIVTYILYTVDPQTIQKIGTPYLFFSVPLVIYCVFRVALLVEAGRVSAPTEVITRDVPFIVAMVVWAVYSGAVVMWGRQIQEFLSQTVRPLLEK